MKKTIFAITMNFLFVSVNSQTGCELIARWGIYDTRTYRHSSEMAISFLKIFQRDSDMTYEEAKNWSAEIGIPIDDILIKASGKASSETYKKFIDKIKSTTKLDESLVEDIKFVSKTVNKDIVQVLKQCYDKDGIHVRLENTIDDNISYLYLKYNRTGGGKPVKLKLSWSCPNDDVSVDGKKRKNSYRFIVKLDENKTITIKRKYDTVAVDLAINTISGENVPVYNGGQLIYAKAPLYINIPKGYDTVIPSSTLRRSSVATFINGGDEELKRFKSTVLEDGRFDLRLLSEVSLEADLSARIRENQKNYTTFGIKQTYPIFKAPDGYRIVSYRVIDDSGNGSKFHDTQYKWIQPGRYFDGNGPLKSYTWQGDSGDKKDQQSGVWIRPTIKPIIIKLEKK
jgi:hypothetical protein